MNAPLLGIGGGFGPDRALKVEMFEAGGPNLSLGNQMDSSRRAIPAHITEYSCSLFVLIKSPAMTSRVRRRGQRIACPASLGSIAAPALVDQHQACGAPGLGRKLEPPTGPQRDRLFRCRDHQGHRPRAQRLFDRPKQIRLIARLDKMQAPGHAIGQGSRHWPVPVMRQHDPEDRPRQPHGLKQGKAGSPPTFDLMHPRIHQ